MYNIIVFYSLTETSFRNLNNPKFMPTKSFTITQMPFTVKTIQPIILTYALSHLPLTIYIKCPKKPLVSYKITNTTLLNLKVTNNTTIKCDTGTAKIFYNLAESAPYTKVNINNNDIVENMRVEEITCENSTDVILEIGNKRAFVCRAEKGTKKVCLEIDKAKFILTESVWLEGSKKEEITSDENDVIFNEMTSVFEEEDRICKNKQRNRIDEIKKIVMKECKKTSSKKNEGEVQTKRDENIENARLDCINSDEKLEKKNTEAKENKKTSKQIEERAESTRCIDKTIEETKKHKKDAKSKEKKEHSDSSTNKTNEDISAHKKVKVSNDNTKEKVKIEILEEGKGSECKKGDKVKITYKGMLENDTVFQEISKPFTFVLGNHTLIDGIEMGIEGMRIGEKRKIAFGPDLGYGKERVGIIPKNSDLKFEVTMVKIIKE